MISSPDGARPKRNFLEGCLTKTLLYTGASALTGLAAGAADFALGHFAPALYNSQAPFRLTIDTLAAVATAGISFAAAKRAGRR